MKFFKNKAVAIILTVAVAFGCLVYGASKKPADIPSDLHYGEWVADKAGILSNETETIVEGYLDSWEKSGYEGKIALATVDSTRNWDIYDYSVTLGHQWGLGTDDSLILIDNGGDQYYVVTSERIEELGWDRVYNIFKDDFEPAYNNGNFDAAVRNVYASLDRCMAETYNTGYTGSYYNSFYDAGQYSVSTNASSAAASLIFFLIIVIIIANILDKARYRRWYRSYGTVARPAVNFVPLVFWHRPGGLWYRRMNTAIHTTPGRTGVNVQPNTTYHYTYNSTRPGSSPKTGTYYRPPKTGSSSGVHGGFGSSGSGFGGSRSGFSSGSRSGFSSGSRSGFSSGSRGGFSGGSHGGFGGGSRGGFGGHR